MAKRALTLHVRLPPYHHPRQLWRQQIYEAVVARQKEVKVHYRASDKLEIHVRLYLTDQALRFHDVDNRLKDIMDALQGRVGGPKSVRTLESIVPNDNQIYRVTIEKCPSPLQSRGLSHLTIRKYNGPSWLSGGR